MREGSPLEVLLTFLKLGVSSFGGPVAHTGYFRDEIVIRRRWVEEATFTDLLALCQFLPGPASSQLGFALGLMRAGYGGAVAAWVGFTLPSALAMLAFASGAAALNGPLGIGLAHGLKLVAVAIVAQAVWGMGRALCPDWQRVGIGALAAILMFALPSAQAQLLVIVLGAFGGAWLCRGPPRTWTGTLGVTVSRSVGVAALVAYGALLVGLPLLGAAGAGGAIARLDAFYRSGALVFGGGHVVLPLLRDAVVTPGWVSDSAFLAGYGAAQAMPGPLFTFAAYLGAVMSPAPSGLVGAALGLLGIFLPGFLILIGALPFWDSFRARPGAQAAMRGVNAAVVGLLAAALYSPLWTGTVRGPGDAGLAVGGFLILVMLRAPPLFVVVAGATSGVLLAMFQS